jgi:hypothetical protein
MASTRQKQYPKMSTVKVERAGVIVLERFNLSFDLSERDISDPHSSKTVSGTECNRCIELPLGLHRRF